ncbi:BnaC03g30270D [Brassica napus]|uniref:(rape) hypothetical protein n=1 Tax=Brassica napus TaxID=3708 RepID=A0A078FTV6_BRANA|nr:unnamed protein product [Brassica napus]CDY17955.1 BnaC03g30270D [Brassica napus]
MQKVVVCKKIGQSNKSNKDHICLNIIKTIYFLMCIYIHTFFLIIIYAHKKKFKKDEYEEIHFIDDDGINNNCDHGKKSRRKSMHGQMFVLVRIFLSRSSSMPRQMEIAGWRL